MKKQKMSLSFYDLKAKKKFKSDVYEIVKKGKMNFAKTKAPSGIESWLIVKKDFAATCK